MGLAFCLCATVVRKYFAPLQGALGGVIVFPMVALGATNILPLQGNDVSVKKSIWCRFLAGVLLPHIGHHGVSVDNNIKHKVLIINKNIAQYF